MTSYPSGSRPTFEMCEHDLLERQLQHRIQLSAQRQLNSESHHKLLGIIFEYGLCFNANLEPVRTKCVSRLNIIKILSLSPWKLNSRTLINIYRRALTSSLIDYCSGHHSLLVKTTLQKLQRIQNLAVRSIYRLLMDTPTVMLNFISGIGTVDGGLRYLCNQHLCAAVKHNSELIDRLIK